jgi:hypothetical protein
MMNRMASPSFYKSSACTITTNEGRLDRHRLCVAVVTAVVGVVSTINVDAKQAQGSASCRDPGFAAKGESSPTQPQLKPRDDGFRRPDFEEFRRHLQDAVARKDEEAILKIVDPGVRVDFGDGGGLEAFERRMNAPGENFFEELTRVLNLGGRFRTPDAFDAPYVYSDWPDGVDAFACAAVVGSGVRLRAAPDIGARTLTTVDFAIVKLFPNEPAAPGWRRLALASGLTGYIASRYVRSPIDYRALFEFKEGRWWLVAFVAGD